MQKGTMIRILVILPLLVLIAVVVIGALSKSDGTDKKQPRPSIGEQARDFTYPDLDGHPVKLSDYFANKVVMVNIWATWCTECRKELPTVQHLYEKFKDRGFEVLAISIDAAGARVIKPFMKELGLTFPALQDTAGSSQLLYGTSGVPETFIIDKQGQIAYVEIGAGDWTEPGKEDLIQGLIEERGTERQ